ncbi:MAG: hypothetical protein R3F37_04340 [Candidatus Competibacteraceae bacterium]
MAETTAWLLDFDGDLMAAAESEMVHVIQAPVLLKYLKAPIIAGMAPFRQNNILPVMDVAVWLRKLPGRQVCPVPAF